MQIQMCGSQKNLLSIVMVPKIYQSREISNNTGQTHHYNLGWLNASQQWDILLVCGHH